MLDGELWRRTRNPWLVLQNTPRQRLQSLAADARFLAELARVQRGCDALPRRGRTPWDETSARPAFKGPDCLLQHGVRHHRGAADLLRRTSACSPATT
ncbi:MAG: DUF3417 domain-containing protein [Comamonadaceae bacterium]|nr:DUF3417 domain-containing protein [Comamonadaceae bacterium]